MQIEVLSENQRSAAVPPIVVVCLARLTFGTSLPRYQGGREESAATSNRYLSIKRKKPDRFSLLLASTAAEDHSTESDDGAAAASSADG